MDDDFEVQQKRTELVRQELRRMVARGEVEIVRNEDGEECVRLIARKTEYALPKP